MSTAPLDAAPERRTEECSPRSRAGDRLWSQSSDTYRQAIRKRNVGPLAECDRSCDPVQFLSYIYMYIYIYILIYMREIEQSG